MARTSQCPGVTLVKIFQSLSALTFALVTFALSHVASAETLDGRVIELWVRGEGPQDGAFASRAVSRRVELDHLPLKNVERYDAQYDQVKRYRGISLRDLFRRFPSDRRYDLAILHFENGMAVPFPFRDRVAVERLDPFIAVAPRQLGKQGFPALQRQGPTVDPRPVSFLGNKIVVAQRWHPAVAAASEPSVSPWTRVDTLVSVEVVASAPYYAQLDVGDDEPTHRGLTLYRENCQFCHGARHVGASFGWDFVDAPPVYDYRNSAANLYHNVAYKPQNASELGLLMPALRSLTEEDAGYLQAWLRAIAIRPMPPYRLARKPAR